MRATLNCLDLGAANVAYRDASNTIRNIVSNTLPGPLFASAGQLVVGARTAASGFTLYLDGQVAAMLLRPGQVARAHK